MAQNLKAKLNILRLSTGQLIDHFYSDLLQHQREEGGKEKRVGELVVSVGYIKETSAVEVNVVQARDIGMHKFCKPNHFLHQYCINSTGKTL